MYLPNEAPEGHTGSLIAHDRSLLWWWKHCLQPLYSASGAIIRAVTTLGWKTVEEMLSLTKKPPSKKMKSKAKTLMLSEKSSIPRAPKNSRAKGSNERWKT